MFPAQSNATVSLIFSLGEGRAARAVTIPEEKIARITEAFSQLKEQLHVEKNMVYDLSRHTITLFEEEAAPKRYALSDQGERHALLNQHGNAEDVQAAIEGLRRVVKEETGIDPNAWREDQLGDPRGSSIFYTGYPRVDSLLHHLDLRSKAFRNLFSDPNRGLVVRNGKTLTLTRAGARVLQQMEEVAGIRDSLLSELRRQVAIRQRLLSLAKRDEEVAQWKEEIGRLRGALEEVEQASLFGIGWALMQLEGDVSVRVEDGVSGEGREERTRGRVLAEQPTTSGHLDRLAEKSGEELVRFVSQMSKAPLSREEEGAAYGVASLLYHAVAPDLREREEEREWPLEFAHAAFFARREGRAMPRPSQFAAFLLRSASALCEQNGIAPETAFLSALPPILDGNGDRIYTDAEGKQRDVAPVLLKADNTGIEGEPVLQVQGGHETISIGEKLSVKREDGQSVVYPYGQRGGQWLDGAGQSLQVDGQFPKLFDTQGREVVLNESGKPKLFDSKDASPIRTNKSGEPAYGLPQQVRMKEGAPHYQTLGDVALLHVKERQGVLRQGWNYRAGAPY